MNNSLLSENERDEIWDTNKIVPVKIEECMHTKIAAQAVDHAGKLAVDAWDGQLTYTELDQLSTRLASKLQGYGVGPEVIVPLCFEKSIYTVVSVLAVLKAGGAFALLDVNQPKTRLREIIQQCRPKVVCTSIKSKDLCPPEIPTIIPQNDLDDTNTNDFTPLEPSPSWPMYVCFTSGSTGRPKGIVMTHSAFSSAQYHQSEAFCFHQEARVFDFASYAFDVAVYNVMMTLAVGATLCIPSEEQRKGALNQTLRDMNITMTALTPSTSRLLEPSTLSSLETLILSGEAVTESDLQRLSEGSFRVLNAYGPAECTPMSTLNASPIEPEISTHMGVGIGAVTWVVDPSDHTKLVPRGAPGELLLEGPILARGYLEEPEKTAASFINDPPWLLEGSNRCPGRKGKLYKTGDIVCYEGENLRFIGRKDSQVKIRGQRFELGEVEHHVRNAMSSTVQIVAEVINLGGDREKAMLTIFLTGSEGWHDEKPLNDSASLVTVNEDTEKVLIESLPGFMVPSIYIRLNTMPLSVTGKADRGKLRQMGEIISPKRLLELQGDNIKTKPQNATETLLRDLWAAVLGLKAEDISTTDKFIRLGGDSIAAMKLVGAARKSGVVMSVADVFRNPTIIQQAQLESSVGMAEQVTAAPFSLLDHQDIEELATACATPTALIEDAYPCTPLQEGMFTLSTQKAGDYILQAVLELSPGLNIELFKTAWESVYKSTEALRTRFVQGQDSKLTQVVCGDTLEWKHAMNLQEYMENDKYSIMGLGQKLVRFALIGDCTKPSHFVWTAHHALYDGWSLQLISNMVRQVMLEGKLEEDTTETVKFSTFVQHVLCKNESETERYWQSYLENSETATFPALPVTMKDRPEANASIEMELSPRTKAGITQSTMIRGALGVLIGQYTATKDVVFGAVVSGRNAPVAGIESIRGPTIATVPIRVQLEASQSTAEYLQNLQDAATDMIPHEQIGLQKLSKMGDEGRNACGFQTLLVVQPQEDELESDEILGKWQTSATEQGFTTYAITIECLISKNGGMRARASYDPRVIDEWRMTKLLEQLNAILEQLATQSVHRIEDIEILTRKDRDIISQWNKTEPEFLNDCIHNMIKQHATETPDSPAIDSWDGKITHKELDHLSDQVAQWLIASGVGPEIVVPLCFEKSMYTVIAILGVFKSGGAFVLLDPGSPDSRLRKLCEQVNAKVAITSSSCKSRLSDFIPTILSLDKQFFASNRATSIMPRANPSNAAYIIFTSGSTGVPKGVVIQHNSYCSAVVSHNAMNMSSSMRALQFGSYNFARIHY